MSIRFRRDRRRPTLGSRAAPIRGTFIMRPQTSVSATSMDFNAYAINSFTGQNYEIGFGAVGREIGNVNIWGNRLNGDPAIQSLPNALVIPNNDPTNPVTWLRVFFPSNIFNPLSPTTQISMDLFACNSPELAGYVAGPSFQQYP